MTDYDNRVKVLRGYSFLEVSIDGLPHLLLDNERLIGFQAWEEGHPATGFAIEFAMAGSEPVVSRYNIRLLWEAIIKKISACLQSKQEAKPDA